MSEMTTTSKRPLLVANDLRKHFPLKGKLFTKTKQVVQAVDDISFEVYEGETLGIVGESGCGKSTTARLLLHLIKPDAGEVVFDGKAVGKPNGIAPNALYRRMQMVFQDSYASLNPRLSIAQSIAFGPMVQGLPKAQALKRASSLLERVGLASSIYANRYPHELSGGQRQRVNISRALAFEPKLLVLDEAVSALDKSVEAQVLNLLSEIKAAFDLTYVFISHDLSVVRYMSDRVMVMYLGKVVEIGPVGSIYSAPRHPYTQALLAAMPSMSPRKRTQQAPLTGDPPNPIDPPSGCRFRTRCPFAAPVCADKAPRLGSHGGPDRAHQAACHLFDPAAAHPRAKEVRDAQPTAAV